MYERTDGQLEAFEERQAVTSAVIRPIQADQLKDRVIRLTSGAQEYGSSEDLWQEVHDFISRYVVVSDSWYHISTGMIFLSWRFSDAHFNLAIALEKVGSRLQAADHFRQYLQLAGNTDTVWCRLAKSHLAYLEGKGSEGNAPSPPELKQNGAEA